MKKLNMRILIGNMATKTIKTTATKAPSTKKILTGPNPNTRKPDLAYIQAWQECRLTLTSPLTGAKIGQNTPLYNDLLDMYDTEIEKNVALATPYTAQDVEATRDTNKYYLPSNAKVSPVTTPKTTVTLTKTTTPTKAKPTVVPTSKTQPAVVQATPATIDYAYIHKWRTCNTVDPGTGKVVKVNFGPWSKCEAKCVEQEQKRGTITAKHPCVLCSSTVKSLTGCCLKCVRAQLNDDTIL